MIIRNSISGQIYKELKTKIINNNLKLGEKISINEISKKYKVSYTPAREAVKNLVKEGLIINVQNSVHRVFNITEKDLFEVMEIRKMCECYSIEYTTRDTEKEVINHIYQEALELKNHKYESHILYDEFLKSDLKFHRTIIESTRNHRLIELYNSIYDSIKTVIFRIAHNEKRDDICQFISEHISLLESLLSKDLNKSKKLLSDHIDHSYRYYLENFIH
jgi:DNA-binding GntR family transcriptional regulator